MTTLAHAVKSILSLYGLAGRGSRRRPGPVYIGRPGFRT
jgi:hypothetical protein